MKRQQLLDSPAMIRDASGHCRCGPATGGGQTRMRGAKIIDRPDQIHPMLQGQRAARQRPASTRQRGQPSTKRRVEPLDVGRIDDAVALRTLPERLNACRRAIDHASFGLDHTAPLVALDHLGDQDMTPRTQPGPSTRPRVHGITKGLPHGPDVRHQAVGTNQQGTPCRTAPHPLAQTPDEGHVPLLADLAAQPQACPDHHGQGHPHDAALFLHANLIGLHLPEIAGLSTMYSWTACPWRPERAHQSATVRSSNPNAATIACTGHPWASKVTTSTTVSAEVRNR